MNRFDVTEILGPLRRDAAVMIGPGLAMYAVAREGDYPMTIYNIDMPYATAMSVGVALGWPALKVVSVEGDGSLLMGGQNSLVTVARYKPENLIVLVFDNGYYLTTGSGTVKTATTTGTDIELLGKGAGLTKTITVREVSEARAALERAFREPGPWLIVAKIDTSDRDRSSEFQPLPTDCHESGQRFRTEALKRGAPAARQVAPAG